MNGGVLCAGRVYGDLVFSGLPRQPAPGEELYADALSLHAGGGAYITAAWLAALGRPSALCARLPCEPFGSLVAAEARAGGVALEATVVAGSGDPQLTVAISANGDRSFATRRSGAALPPDHVDALALPGLVHLHIGELATLLEHPDLVPAARRAGLGVSLDCGWDEQAFADPELERRLVGVDVFLPNEAEAAALAGRELAVPLTVVKRGARGATAVTAGARLDAVGETIEPLDTTGAGDAFDAGFLHAWLGRHPIARCLALGNACGASCAMRRGGAGELPSLAHLLERVDIRSDTRADTGTDGARR